jgi:hypothetical protein
MVCSWLLGVQGWPGWEGVLGGKLCVAYIGFGFEGSCAAGGSDAGMHWCRARIIHASGLASTEFCCISFQLLHASVQSVLVLLACASGGFYALSLVVLGMKLLPGDAATL